MAKGGGAWGEMAAGRGVSQDFFSLNWSMVILAELNQSQSAVLVCVCEPVCESVCSYAELPVSPDGRMDQGEGSQVGLDCEQMENKVTPACGGLSEAGAKVQLLVMDGATFLHAGTTGVKWLTVSFNKRTRSQINFSLITAMTLALSAA